MSEAPVPSAAPKAPVQKFFITKDDKIVAELNTPTEVSAALPALLEESSNVHVIRGRKIPFKQTVSVKLNLREQAEGDDGAE